ncbi:hypothetical protein LOTGIDRAFT_152580 [Lottia gigantea]|uniref:Uncharacterized protein n=1 Tax=Lottia gigantea TaxID=225164 RepID=V4CT13_LOTGI|nr:hypothetical protein LOTGIDRAFT_152580 [Lottia gigantea]ESP05710.1 hypothetical protein LOTGIDRAFT_152580 [Lottia gigantea]
MIQILIVFDCSMLSRIFNQTNVLVRVPNTFLILGGIVFVLQVIGIILTFPPPMIDYEDLDLVTNSSSRKEADNKKPLEIIKDPGGILLWSVTFLTILIFWGVQLIYKNFGQTFISDDHFLSAIGTSGCVVSAVYRVILSLLADKIGTKGIVGFIFPLIIGLLKDIGWENTIFILAGLSTLGFACSGLLRLPWLPFRNKPHPHLDLNSMDDKK